MIVAAPQLRDWLQAKVGMTLAEDAQFMGIIREGEIKAAAAFSHYTGCDIEMSVAGEPGSGSKGFLKALFAYAFEQCGCVRCTVKTRASNARAIKLAKRLGFVQEGVQRLGFGDEDAVLFGLLRNDYGKRRRQATSGT